MVQLKGFTTFQPIEGLPSMTLDFEKLSPKQKFHGLRKISLNNSLQDPTRLHEKISRELFAAAGVPVPRADFAVVTLNGRELGLYVLTEGFDKDFLKHHFQRADGNLYEGGILKDIDQSLRLSLGRSGTNQADVQQLISAARESDPDQRWRALNAVLDMDRFLSMMAMETILCHSDSYSMNRNNYRLYHDPTTDKMVFMPHGMDRVLGTHRSYLDLSVVSPVLGLVARAVLSTPEGRRRHVERVGDLVTNVFDPDRLCRRVRDIDGRIISAKTNQSPNSRFDRRLARSAAQDADNLCERISDRASELKFQLANVQELLHPPRTPEFDTNGVASLENWTPKRRAARTESYFDAKIENNLLHLKTTNGPLKASLQTRVTLLAGNYRLTGQNMATNSSGATNLITLTALRCSSERFAIERQSASGQTIHLSFAVNTLRAPEEIEFVCELRENGTEVWFNPSSLKLIAEQK
jgi:spore coat protein H